MKASRTRSAAPGDGRCLVNGVSPRGKGVRESARSGRRSFWSTKPDATETHHSAEQEPPRCQVADELSFERTTYTGEEAKVCSGLRKPHPLSAKYVGFMPEYGETTKSVLIKEKLTVNTHRLQHIVLCMFSRLLKQKHRSRKLTGLANMFKLQLHQRGKHFSPIHPTPPFGRAALTGLLTPLGATLLLAQVSSALTITDNFADPSIWGTSMSQGGNMSVGSGRMNYTSTSTSTSTSPGRAPVLGPSRKASIAAMVARNDSVRSFYPRLRFPGPWRFERARPN